MPFMESRVAATYAREILRTVNGSEIAENAVVDGTTVPLNGDGRRVLESGTVMVYTAGIGSKVAPAAASGVLASAVAGILMHTTEFWPGTTSANKDDAPVALFTKNCDFAISQLINYSGSAAEIRGAMEAGGRGGTGGLGVCGNNHFST